MIVYFINIIIILLSELLNVDFTLQLCLNVSLLVLLSDQ